jgi:protein O-mannosyl-transferase
MIGHAVGRRSEAHGHRDAHTPPTGDSISALLDTWNLPLTGFFRGHRRIAGLLAVSFIFAATLVAYSPAMRGGFIWDDDQYIVTNLALRTPHGLWRAWSQTDWTPQYYPLVFTTFWAEYQLWGTNPLGYHVVNVLLHAASAVVLWRVLRRLGVPGAFLAAAVFALHPVHVESVAWATERKNVLSGVLYLSSLSLYLRACNLPARNAPRYRWGFYAAALLLFWGALLSKTVTCSLPAAILLILWWKRGRLLRRDLLPLIPMFAIGLGMGLLTAWVERSHVGAMGPDWALSPVQRVLIAGRALWFYAFKLVAPHPLIFIYPRWQVSAGAAWQYAFPAAAIAAISTLWLLRRRIGPQPLVAVLFFAGTLLPALGFINVFPMRYSFVADHFQYLASIGLIALFAGIVVRYLPRRAVLPVSVAWLAVLAVLTWRQGYAYKDLPTLWRDVLAKNDSAWIAHSNLAVELQNDERYDEALQHCERAIAIAPQAWEPLNNRGFIHLVRLQLPEAMRDFRKAIEVGPAAQPYHNLGRALFEQGKYTEAIAAYESSLNLQAWNVSTLKCLGRALAAAGRNNEAVQRFSEALLVKNDDPDAYLNMGNALRDLGRYDEACARYATVLRLDPASGDAHNEWGVALARQNRIADAAEHYAEAVRLAPDKLDVRFNLAEALRLQGKLPEAEAVFRELLKLQPGDADAHAALGDVLRSRGQRPEADSEYRAALAIDPQNGRAHQGLATAPAQ